MVNLYTLHNTVRKFSTQHYLDGFGSGLHISYHVPNAHTSALISALHKIGFVTTHTDSTEIVLQCNYLEVFILPDAQFTSVIFSNLIAPSYIAINCGVGTIPG